MDGHRKGRAGGAGGDRDKTARWSETTPTSLRAPDRRPAKPPPEVVDLTTPPPQTLETPPPALSTRSRQTESIVESIVESLDDEPESTPPAQPVYPSLITRKNAVRPGNRSHELPVRDSAPRNVSKASIASSARPSVGGSVGMPSSGLSNRQYRTTRNEKDEHVKAVLQNYLSEMKEDHAYVVRNSLAAARLDINQRKVYKGNGIGGLPGILYDDESPFKNMHSVAITTARAAELKPNEVKKFTAFHYIKPHTASHHKLVLKTAVLRSVIPPPPEVPKYRCFTTLRKNISADNDENLRYLPYFGEDAQDEDSTRMELQELYVDKTAQTVREGHIAEWASMYELWLEDFLGELGLDGRIIGYYLVGDISKIRGGNDPQNTDVRREESLPDGFDPTDEKTMKIKARLNVKHRDFSASELEKCEMVAHVFKEMTDVSLWDCIKNRSTVGGHTLSPSKTKEGLSETAVGMKALTGGSPWPYSLESYALMSCAICYMHECPFHVFQTEISSLKPSRSSNTSSAPEHADVPNESERTASARKTMEPDDSQGPINGLRGWSEHRKTALVEAYPEGEPCSDKCFTNPKSTHKPRTKWTNAQTLLLRSSAAVLGKNKRCSCLLALIINRPCSEIHARLRSENLIPPSRATSPSQLIAPDPEIPEPPRGQKRKKAGPSGLPGYPADCWKTTEYDSRAHFEACSHSGACNDTCPCYLAKVTCEKSCCCPENCPRRWRGCNCRREGRPCSTEKCSCIKASRECDPDLCGSCGALEALDRVNRYGNNHLKGYCGNIWIQRDQPRRTMLGRSTVAGMGLYAAQSIKKDDFIGEYKGEIITSDEADRRGKIYDVRGVSFLFNLNKNHVIDATRAGNKLRFINHSSKRPNCQAKVLMVNCVHRIGLYAKRNINPGEELFFDYGYSNKQVKFVQLEPPEVKIPGGAAGKKKASKSAARKGTEEEEGEEGSGVASEMEGVQADKSIPSVPSSVGYVPDEERDEEMGDAEEEGSEEGSEEEEEEDDPRPPVKRQRAMMKRNGTWVPMRKQTYQ